MRLQTLEKNPVNVVLVICMRTHRGEKPFQCRFYDKAISNKNDILKFHMAEHSGDTREKQPQCISDDGKLLIHMGTHTGDKPYQCTTCNMSFLNKRDLLKHKMTHTGKKPFQCCSCDKCFSYNNNLFIHMRTHRGEKPFQCKFYDEAISNKNDIL